MRPQVLIFDWGGVFVRFKMQGSLWSGFIAEHDADPAQVLEHYSEGYFDYERGLLTKEFFERIKNGLGYRHDFKRFSKDFCEVFEFELDKDMFDLLLQIKSRYGGSMELWALSNINELHYNHLLKRWPGLPANFRRVFLSFKMGSRKPEPEIYERMLGEGTSRRSPYVCLFVDDLEVNGEYPRRIQMPFIRFEGREQLKKTFLQFEIKLD